MIINYDRYNVDNRKQYLWINILVWEKNYLNMTEWVFLWKSVFPKNVVVHYRSVVFTKVGKVRSLVHQRYFCNILPNLEDIFEHLSSIDKTKQSRQKHRHVRVTLNGVLLTSKKQKPRLAYFLEKYAYFINLFAQKYEFAVFMEVLANNENTWRCWYTHKKF